MKLFGGSRKRKHLATGRPAVNNEGKTSGKKQKNRAKTWMKVLIAVLAVVLALLIALYVAIKVYVKPPDTTAGRNPAAGETTGQVNPNNPNSGNTNPDTPPSDTDSRTKGVYTFLVLGTDDGNGNTDTMMVASFDTNTYEFNVVSIPRDTLVNVSWAVKKANTLYGVGGIDGMKEGLADILGFNVDFYVVVDLAAFVKLVDSVGGIYYDVPQTMKYKDPAQNLYIDVAKGYQKLDGKTALGVMRFRSGYANADIGRIGTQQDFLKTAALQILENKSQLDISALADIFLNYVETDLTYGEIIWLAKEFFKVDSQNIEFMTLPGDYEDACYHGGKWVSYVTIYVDKWLEMINTHLNPFEEDITIDNVDIYTRDQSTGKLYTTTGVFAGKSSWGYGSASSGTSNSSGSAGSSGTSTTPSDTTQTPQQPEDTGNSPEGTETSTTGDTGTAEAPDSGTGTTEPQEAPADTAQAA